MMYEMDVKTRKVKSRRRPASQVRRRRPCSDPVNLSVTLSIPQHVQEKISREWIIRVSAKALLLHTLYSRGVCPAPANETLRAAHENSDGTRRMNPIERKFIKFGGCLQRLLDEWTLLCSLVHVDRVLITLGPSWSRQRELFILDFSVDDFAKDQKTEPGLGQEHALSRRLVRALLNGITDQTESANDVKSLAHPSPSGSSYMVHLSVWISHQTADSLFAKSVNDDVSSPLQKLLQSLILRPNYSVTTGKRTQPLVTVTAKVTSSDRTESDWNEEDGVWISLPTSLKGFRL